MAIALLNHVENGGNICVLVKFIFCGIWSVGERNQA